MDLQKTDETVSLETTKAFTSLKTKQSVFNLNDKFTYLTLTLDFCDLGLAVLNESPLPLG